MPTTPFDSDPKASLEPQAPPPKRKGRWVWLVLMLLLLAVLAGALIISARAQFNRDYERALNNILLQQGNVVATLGSGK